MHRQRFSHTLSGILFLLAGWPALAQSPSPADLDLQAARGSITRVTCLQDPAQSYALYLPSHYTPDRAWPILYAFDPFARGKTAVEVYKDAAEKYGYIVAGSNNSRNGPSADQLAAAQAMWADTHRRLTIDKDRVYTTGLSGGARVATAFALYCYTCSVAGVIAHGAGYPVMTNVKPPGNEHFAYYVAIGDADFNFPEIVALRRKKDQAGAPFKVKVYPGPHQWAPPEIAEDAIEWLELKAMQAGTEKADPALVQKLFDRTQSEAAQAQQHGDALTQYYALRSLVEDFRGLKEIAPFASQLAEIKSSRALKSAEHAEQKDIEEQASLTATVAGELAQYGSPDLTGSGSGQLGASPSGAPANLEHHIVSVMSDLKRRGSSSSHDHLVCARAFTQLWVQALEAGQNAFHDNNLPTAQAYFQLMSEASPGEAWPLVLLAEVQVRSGNKKAALKDIEQAVHRGLKHAQSLTQDPELQPLASDPAFQRIVQNLSAQ
ncbi:MAG TPA: hypothetical protein VKW06_20120 [Candidatus Angelobacter sp.]|nr:hypothetical protein [Candidatus Angelobacter sp.]